MTRILTATLSFAILGASFLTGCVDSGSTRPESDVSNLVGMRARNLDYEMNNRGFKNVGGYKTENSSITMWWNANIAQCVKVDTTDGRVASTEAILAGNCR